MSKAEILAELPKLNPEDLAEVQAKLDELAGESWLDGGELSDADKAALESALSDYRNSPDAVVVLRVLHSARHDREWRSSIPPT
jgi:hypothetical protein